MSSSFFSFPTQPRSFAAVYRLYAALAGALPFDSERGLGGRLLYAGKIEAENRLQTAASVAGAASLGAAAETAVLRQAMRDGTIDFLVTSLEEALRILKNEVRKKQTVAVGVSVAPERLVGQMIERGVLPDLLPPVRWDLSRTGMDEGAEKNFWEWGALRVAEPAGENGEFVTWMVERRPAVWLPRLDFIAMSVVPEADVLRRRWLRLAPRYLGRAAMQQRGVMLSPTEIERFRTEMDALVAARAAAGEESTVVRIERAV